MTGGASGLVQGGLGGPEDQLLEAGQEEVFSRAEVESGRIEHHADTQTRPDPRVTKSWRSTRRGRRPDLGGSGRGAL